MWRLTLLNWKREHKCYTKTANINVQKLTSLNLVLRTTIMTPVKPQISKFKAEKSCQVGFNVSRRLYSWAFFKRVKSFVHVSVLSVCIWIAIATVLSTFRTDQPRFKFSPWAISTDFDRQDITYKRNANVYERLHSLKKRSWVEPPWYVKAHLARLSYRP